MKEINNDIVISEDIERIFNGINALDFKYQYIPEKEVINNVRKDLKKELQKIFKNNISIIKEEEMLSINNLIKGDYPHCYIR